jgi:hypothetical protein
MTAKDRDRLAPQTANEIVFLHDALPAIKKYATLNLNV